MSTTDLKALLGATPVVPVLTIDSVRSALPLARALVAGGLPVLEITLRTPAALDAIRAVSEEVARAMAAGCRERSGSTFALSVTGVAGPTGGSPDKPVGLVFIGLADASGQTIERRTFGSHLSREGIRDRACKTALDMLRQRLG